LRRSKLVNKIALIENFFTSPRTDAPLANMLACFGHDDIEALTTAKAVRHQRTVALGPGHAAPAHQRLLDGWPNPGSGGPDWRRPRDGRWNRRTAHGRRHSGRLRRLRDRLHVGWTQAAGRRLARKAKNVALTGSTAVACRS